MKRIAIVSNTSWYIYNFRLNMIKEFKRRGFSVIVISPYDDYSERLIKFDCEYANIAIQNKGTNPLKDLMTINQFYKLYKNFKPNIILQFTIKPNVYGTIAARLLSIPTINNIAGLGTLFQKKSTLYFIGKSLYKISQKYASKVFFQNYEDMELFTKTYKLIPQNICERIPGSGVDITKFSPTPIKSKSDKFVFTLISRMLWEKGVGDLIKAGKILRNKGYDNFEIQLVGFLDVDNPSAITKDEMNKWENEEYIKYLGISDNVKEIIKNTDCFVLPSFYREGVPRTLLEAAAMAKPIITTNNVGCKEVVDDGVNGFLCNVKDPHDLADKMKKMVNLTENERMKMGKKGREKVVKEFDERIVIDKYIEAINEILCL